MNEFARLVRIEYGEYCIVLVSVFKPCYIYDPSYDVLVVILFMLSENNKRKEKSKEK